MVLAVLNHLARGGDVHMSAAQDFADLCGGHQCLFGCLLSSKPITVRQQFRDLRDSTSFMSFSHLCPGTACRLARPSPSDSRTFKNISSLCGSGVAPHDESDCY